MKPALFAVLSLLVLTTACQQATEPVIKQQFLAFGTLIEVSYYAVEQHRADAATQAVEALFLQEHHDWHAWQPGPLQDLNQAIAAGKPATVPASILTLIRLGQRYEQQSQGYFNPAIGQLLRLWGFQQDEAPQWQAPDPAAIEAITARKPSSLQLHIEKDRVRSENSAVQLDFGAFAKGYGIGRAMELLQSLGIDNAVVNAGGDLCVSGRHGQRLWQIGIRHPRKPGVIASVAMQPGSCVFTSGDYERYVEKDGQRINHILNPKTGYPATQSRAVTVIDNDPTRADAAATALFVAGPEHWQEIAAAMNIHYVFLIDNQGRLYMNPAMAERLDINRDDEPAIMVSRPLPLTTP